MVTIGVELLIWNKARNGSVSFSKINVLQIENDNHNGRDFIVKAYLTDGTDVFMGEWSSERKAKEYMQNIHKEVRQIQIATIGFTEDRLREILKEIISEVPNHLDRDPMLDM